MGIVWEAYHKGVPLLGVPGITPRKGYYWFQLKPMMLKESKHRFRHHVGPWVPKVCGRELHW